MTTAPDLACPTCAVLRATLPPGRVAGCAACAAVLENRNTPPRPLGDPRVQLWRAPPDGPGDDAERPPRRAPPDENRELTRVRTLLYALRPDCPDPCYPPPREAPSSAAPRIRDPMAGWGDVPPGIDAPRVVSPDSPAAEAIAAIGRLPEDARALCGWLRAFAVLDTLRGLYVDVGLAFCSAEQEALWGRDLTARRVGAAVHGRRLVLGAVRAWGLPDP